MGFRTGAFAKVWEVTPMSDTSTKVRMSISRKNKQSGEYEQDFSGFVLAIGTAAAKKAAGLKEGNRIKLGDVDVTTKYDKEKKITLLQIPTSKCSPSSLTERNLVTAVPSRSPQLMRVKSTTTACLSKGGGLWEKSITHRSLTIWSGATPVSKLS